ncbi:nucleotidyltransferase domain-containing protein [Candidatus Woesearchaeota archaeon]|nr:nucleotidyltransferase domain-containing protein [Candidatus Woesearchaeota archaeon]
MKFQIPRKANPNLELYNKSDMDIATQFAAEIEKELKAFLRAVVIFGSSARGTQTKGSDVDVLLVIDDTLVDITPELVEAYRLIVQRYIMKISPRLHIISLRFSSFWEYVRNGDPIAINILRDGVALSDTGFFEPLQMLLKKGRIRPTQESIWNYFVRAPNSLHNSKWHVLQGTIDLYWGVIDAAHASLMKLGEIPPSPDHVADMLEQKMVRKGLLEERYATTMRKFYKLSKDITHRNITQISGVEYDKCHKEAQEFIDRMRKFIE